MLIFRNPEFQALVAKAVSEATAKSLEEAGSSLRLSSDLAKLKREVADMEIQQAKKQEGWDKREREVEHKVGLERKRQEFEIAQAKREAVVDVREKNLEADTERFKQEMNFQRTRLEGEITSLRDLTTKLLERLPSAEIFASIGGKGKRA